MSTIQDQINYIKTEGVSEIVKKLKEEKLKNCDVTVLTGLEGAMSAIYGLVINTENLLTKKEQNHNMIVKLMKGDQMFRETSRSFIHFANEILIYSKVLPYYEKIVTTAGITTVNVMAWVPHVYIAKYGHIDGLSVGNSSECVLVMENLKPKGFELSRTGNCLDRDHLLLMVKIMAEYHSLSYVLRIQKDLKLQEFIKEIIPLPYIIKNDSKENAAVNTSSMGEKNATEDTNIFKILFKVAFERFFKYYDKVIETLQVENNDDDARLVENVNCLRIKYGKNPIALMERLCHIDTEEDEQFFVILHGDFNRNNVLYKYETENIRNPDILREIKMIDFQALRFGSPALDLSFALYMNTEADVRDEIWMELIEHYHATLLKTIRDILTATTDDAAAIEESLKLYSFDKFYRHFSKYAFYGVMVCMDFKPWMNCSKDELSKLSYLFETDLAGEEFYKTAVEVGGDYANEKIFSIVRHASKYGFMDYI